MLPRLERTRKENVEKRVANRKSRIEKILTPSDFIPGNIVMQNKDVYSLTSEEMLQQDTQTHTIFFILLVTINTQILC